MNFGREFFFNHREEALVMAHRAEVELLEASKNWQIRVLKEKHYKCAMRLRELLASGGVPMKVVCFYFCPVVYSSGR